MRKHLSFVATAVWNLLLAMLLFTLCRLVFYGMNRGMFPDVDLSRLYGLCKAGLRFDLSAVLYTNLPYLILTFLPLQVRENRIWQAVTKALYVIPNFLACAMNLADSVYFPFTGKRTTCAVFKEFSGDDNLGRVFLHGALEHWYLLVLGGIFLYLLIKWYRKPAVLGRRYGWMDYVLNTAILLVLLYPLVGGLRGGFGRALRPLGINDANLYIEKPIEAGIVLNTPFSMYWTIDVQPFEEKVWYDTPEALEAAFTPVHPADTTAGPLRRKNVVILILESFSTAYSGYQTELQGERRESYMPFLDSLMQESLFFRYSFANGRMSIDAQPAVMCGLPSLVESFTMSLYSNNDVCGLPRLLGERGYSSAFYHGCRRASLALAGFAHKSGFHEEFSRESYGNDADYDGTWGIWDEPFLQYFREGIDQLQEPFLATVFTATSHHPFALPKEYEGVFQPGTMPIHRSIRYSDYSLRRFFEEARKEPWYENTLFVLTGDHTSQTDLPEYLTLHGLFSVPIAFYTPDGSLKGLREGIAQQMDITPTVLGYLGYDGPYFSFGCNLLDTPDEETYAVNYQNGIYFYEQDGYQLQFDGERSIGLYRFTEDRLLEHNLLEAEPERASAMETRIKGIIQQYLRRMIHNELTVE